MSRLDQVNRSMSGCSRKARDTLAGDVIAFGETGHRLLSLIPTDDAAWTSVIDAALAIHSHEHVSEWVTQIELWLAITLPDPWRQ